jgi:hypothetical protein
LLAVVADTLRLFRGYIVPKSLIFFKVIKNEILCELIGLTAYIIALLIVVAVIVGNTLTNSHERI